MFSIRLVPAVALAALCFAAPTFAQAPAPAPAQTPSAGAAQPNAGSSQTPEPPRSPSPNSGAQTAGGTATPVVDSPHGTAIALLDRIQTVLDKAVNGKGDQITLSRGLADEIRAELAQVKLTLQAEKR